jgi:hypothetical protein
LSRRRKSPGRSQAKKVRPQQQVGFGFLGLGKSPQSKCAKDGGEWITTIDGSPLDSKEQYCLPFEEGPNKTAPNPNAHKFPWKCRMNSRDDLWVGSFTTKNNDGRTKLRNGDGKYTVNFNNPTVAKKTCKDYYSS